MQRRAVPESVGGRRRQSLVTGRTVERADYDAHGMGATATEVHSAQVALKYRKGMDPPFVVITSYPVSP
ncbi:hypothetical protein OG242_12645 [Streptomyces sp. NBC_00727]